MTGLANPGVRVLLVGTSMHEPGSRLPDVPAVTRTVTDLARCLTDRCGLPKPGLRTLVDPADPIVFDRAVSAAAREASDVLLVYYVGHGLLSPDGELHLATAASLDLTRPPAPHYQALPYRTLRDTLANCRARTVVVVLDCCFAGRASAALLTGTDDVFAMTAVRDSYLLTAAAPEEAALALPGERHTAFTGALIDLLTRGDPTGPPRLTLERAYRYLARALPAAGRPEPRRNAGGRAGDLMLTDNRAYRPPPPARRPGQPGDDQETVRPDSHTDTDPVEDICPYRGLEAYGPNDARFFFGRDTLTATLLARLTDRLTDPQPVMVVGASGSGKSSLLRAGLIPAVRAGKLDVPGSWEWPCHIITPGSDPLAELASLLARATGSQPEAVRALLADDPQRAADLTESAVDAAMPADTGYTAEPGATAGAAAPTPRMLLVVDQFEELFTNDIPATDQQAFVRALTAAGTPRNNIPPPALVVIGMRADFYGRATEHPELVGGLSDGQVPVGPMTRADLIDVIRRPAQEVGLDLEAGLVEVLLRDLGVGVAMDGVGPGRVHGVSVLPLLSYALLTTWQHRDDRLLTAAGYAATGGIDNAVATTAERVYAALDKAGQAAAHWLLLRLVHVSADGGEDTRRRRSRAELIAEYPDGSAVEAVLDAFATEKARLLTIGQDTVQITHEALLHAWPTLRSWIDTDRSALVAEQGLSDDAKTWRDSGNDPDLLYRGTRLALARERVETSGRHDSLAPAARSFLAASIDADNARAEAERRRARRTMLFAITSTALLILTLVGAGVAVINQRDARSQQQIATARQLIAQADAIRAVDPRVALQLAVAAYRIHPSDETHSGLLSTLTAMRYRGALRNDSGTVSSVAFASDGQTLATGGSDGSILLWELPGQHGADAYGQPFPGQPHAFGRPFSKQRSVVSVAFAPDGRTLATGGGDGTTVLWDVTDHANAHALGEPLAGSGGSAVSVAFAPAGQTLAIGDGDGTPHLWDVIDRAHPRWLNPEQERTAHSGPVTSVAFAPDGQTLATTSGDGSAVRWDVRDRSHPRRDGPLLAGHQEPAYSAAFTSNGRILATGSDGIVSLWDITDPTQARLEQAIAGHRGPVASVAFAPDGHTLATTSGDGSAFLWDLTNRPERLGPPLGHHTPVTEVFFDGNTLVGRGSDGSDIGWDITDRTRPQQLEVPPAGYRDRTLSLALSPSGRTRAIGGDPDGNVTLEDVTDRDHPRQLGQPLTGHRTAVTAAAFAPGEHTLATASSDGMVILWDVADRSRPRRLGQPLTDHLKSVTSVAFAPDGHTLATGSSDHTVILWDVADRSRPRRLGQPLTDHLKSVTSVAFAPDGHTLATGSSDGTAILWDLTSLDDLRKYAVHHACAIAGGSLDRDEWARYIPVLPYRETCPTGQAS
ncbi:AAA family ATPase [Frankia sp. Cj3]|uniref:caspase, EACC1-associated type n=1 Tax=Frankia sp. Cj3 TaxID=2880976 RepID=UPI001EF50EB0|nr:caspase family protein [Frankia sp. Cj3]